MGMSLEEILSEYGLPTTEDAGENPALLKGWRCANDGAKLREHPSGGFYCPACELKKKQGAYYE